ncbi:MAG: hypothetical protein EA401_08260 [Planctomycetota bacterium]|nr:MAG: hypothetical protein EA401_08260 [Planctomycetota bacterium]
MMSDLQWRKRLLIAESDLNRAYLTSEVYRCHRAFAAVGTRSKTIISLTKLGVELALAASFSAKSSQGPQSSRISAKRIFGESVVVLLSWCLSPRSHQE